MKLVKPRDLANRSLGLLSGAIGLARAAKQDLVPGPLWLALHAANGLAQRIAEQPTPIATPAQRRTLQAAGAQIRALAARLIVSSQGRASNSVEAELSELITRTLALIERVTAEPTVIAGHTEARIVIDVSGVEVESESPPSRSRRLR